MAYHLNCVIDPELHKALKAHQQAYGLENISQATRDVLRRGLELCPSEQDAGWKEGYNAACREIRKKVSEALKTPTLLNGLDR